jgi:hypothetical protein
MPPAPRDPDAWPRLRHRACSQAAQLTAPWPGGAGLCVFCRGPARPGNRRCYPCYLHREYLPALLPDVVAPVAYAEKGSPHATNLWLYKSGRPGASAARDALRSLLLVFLRDHGPCVWRYAGMTGPACVAVVPSRRGRPGAHPLRAMVEPYLALPWVRLSLAYRDGKETCDPDPGRFQCGRLPGAAVLLLDDTWTSGSSATSAAAALRLAGARSVAVVVLGRHLDDTAVSGGFSPGPFRPWLCAVHGMRPVRGMGPSQ